LEAKQWKSLLTTTPSSSALLFYQASGKKYLLSCAHTFISKPASKSYPCWFFCKQGFSYKLLISKPLNWWLSRREPLGQLKLMMSNINRGSGWREGNDGGRSK